jgi:hypothetical protein
MNITQWFKDHWNAIVITAIATAKAGVFGKTFSSVVLALAAAFSN